MAMRLTEVQAEWGRTIHRLRLEKELTVSDMASRVGIHRNTLHRIEAGAACSDTVRVRIAAVLGVAPDEIFSYDLRNAS